VLIVFDTYEIVQYDEEAVAGVNALINTLRTAGDARVEQFASGDRRPW
jgi:hypothetical protein